MNDLISRQSVIGYFDKAFNEGWTVQDTLDGLKELPSAQPERVVLTDNEWRMYKKLRAFHNGSYARLLDKLFASARPKRKKGTWDKKSIAFYWKCSECGAVVNNDRHDIFLYPIVEQLNYCPFCGADMRGGKNENT